MTKEKKTTSTKKTSKAKLVKVEEKPFDLIIDFGPAHENEDRKEIELAAAKLVEDKQAEDKASILSSDTVKEFLTQYYTKEKLGENNTRIQPYMTESAYSQELTSQNDAMNQVYKDYILDYHFEKADIFVNQTTNQAIAMVSYNV